VAGAALALSLLVLLSVSTFAFRRSRDVDQQELTGDVQYWLDYLPKHSWHPAMNLPKSIKIDPAVAATPRQWQIIPQRGWGSVTAIDLTRPGKSRAILFVVDSPAKFAVPAAPSPTMRLSLSRGFTATAWQRGDSAPLFVLVVEEDRGQTLTDFLRKAHEA
jgi:hypothetical protein